MGIFEKIKILDDKGEKIEQIAKIDTGAFRTSIDRELARKMGLLKKNMFCGIVIIAQPWAKNGDQ